MERSLVPYQNPLKQGSDGTQTDLIYSSKAHPSKSTCCNCSPIINMVESLLLSTLCGKQHVRTAKASEVRLLFSSASYHGWTEDYAHQQNINTSSFAKVEKIGKQLV